jgi:NADPH2:quinone reductase
MRAIWYDRQGPARDVFKLGELPTPEAGPGEVRVRLEASGVNPSDTYRRAGPGGMEYPRVVPNSDGAGVVDRVGPGVDRAWVGKRVWLYNGQRNGRWCGTAAEYIALSVDLVTELPDSVSFAEGATLGIPAMTAHRCVFVAGPVQGRTLLVTGGAGAVGHYAVQLAAWAGAEVFGTASSTDKLERAKALGLNHGIDYTTTDVVDEVLAPKPARVDRERAWAALARDKKSRNGRTRLVLLEAPGRPVTGVELPDEDVRRELDALIAD